MDIKNVEVIPHSLVDQELIDAIEAADEEHKAIQEFEQIEQEAAEQEAREQQAQYETMINAEGQAAYDSQ
jgi:hypothetical protein